MQSCHPITHSSHLSANKSSLMKAVIRKASSPSGATLTRRGAAGLSHLPNSLLFFFKHLNVMLKMFFFFFVNYSAPWFGSYDGRPVQTRRKHLKHAKTWMMQTSKLNKQTSKKVKLGPLNKQKKNSTDKCCNRNNSAVTENIQKKKTYNQQNKCKEKTPANTKNTKKHQNNCRYKTLQSHSSKWKSPDLEGDSTTKSHGTRTPVKT